jgi:HSP20 family protein
MDIKKIVPWNWFNKEDEGAGKTIPVRHGGLREQEYPLFSPVTQLRQDIDRIFDHAFRGLGFPPFGGDRLFSSPIAGGMLKPTLDVGATDKEYSITIEIPGVDERDVKLEITGNTLTIRGEKKQEKEERERDYYCVERSYGSFQRVLSLPDDVDQERVEAKFAKGVLTVSLPRKTMPQSEVKRIEVKRSE